MQIQKQMLNQCGQKLNLVVWSWTKGNSKQERETWWWDETGEFSKTEKKFMEGVAETRQ